MNDSDTGNTFKNTDTTRLHYGEKRDYFVLKQLISFSGKKHTLIMTES